MSGVSGSMEPVVRAGRTPGSRAAHVVGRSDQRARLRGVLDEVIADGSRFVLLGGDAGAGKTTVIDAFTADLFGPLARPQGPADPRPVCAAGRRRPAVRADRRHPPRPGRPARPRAGAGVGGGRCARARRPVARPRRAELPEGDSHPAAAVRGRHPAVGAGQRARAAGRGAGGHPLGRRVDPAPAALRGAGADRRPRDDHRQLPDRRADPPASAAALPGRDRPAARAPYASTCPTWTGPRSPSC